MQERALDNRFPGNVRYSGLEPAAPLRRARKAFRFSRARLNAGPSRASMCKADMCGAGHGLSGCQTVQCVRARWTSD